MTDLRLAEQLAWADRCEAALLGRGRRLSKSQIGDALATARADLDEDDIQAASSAVMRELRRRSLAAGKGYPILVTDSDLSLIVSPQLRPIHAFLVLLSVDKAFRRLPSTAPVYAPRIFERLVARALVTWGQGQAIVFMDVAGGTFQRGLTNVASALGVQPHPEHARPQRQDHGLDVIAWRPFSDRARGIPVILCQCTVASKHRTLLLKAREVVPAEWTALLGIPQQSLVRALAVPHVISPSWPEWADLTRNSELLIDRLRLLHLIGTDVTVASVLSTAQSKVTLAEIKQWVTNEFGP